jgi:regulatory protein
MPSGDCLFVFPGSALGIITGLQVQKRNKKRVNVEVDGEYAFSLPLEDAALLKKGQALTNAEVTDLQTRDAMQRAVDAAGRLLSLRPRSVQEIRQYLARKEVPPMLMDDVIERLTQMGYVDDRAFAAFWVHERSANKPLSARALRFELRGKGIEKAIVDEVLGEMDEIESAVQAATGYLRRLRGMTQVDAKQKLYAFLARRGFNGSVTRDAMKQVFEALALSEEGDSFFAEPASRFHVRDMNED